MINKRVIAYLFIILSWCSSVEALTIYEDAEDKRVDGWSVQSGGAISNIYDNSKRSRVIKFTSSAYKYYTFPIRNGKNAKQIKWDMKIGKPFYIYINITTTKGSRYLYYNGINTNRGLLGRGVHYGLGRSSIDGKWHTYSRDIEADLKRYEPNNHLISIDSFKVRVIDSSYFDNIVSDSLDSGNSDIGDNIQDNSSQDSPKQDTSTTNIVENAEDKGVDGWSVQSGGAISNIYDNSKRSRVIKFTSSAYKYYTFPIRNGKNAKQIKWDMKIGKPFYIYINITTTKGSRYLYYNGINTNRGLLGRGVHYGLGRSSIDGRWHTYSRDIEADLKRYEPNNHLISIDSFKVRVTNSSYFDNIVLLSSGSVVNTDNNIDNSNNNTTTHHDNINNKNTTLKEVSPPNLSRYISKSPRRVNSIPSGFVEKPFIDASPLIAPTSIEKRRGYILYSRPITQAIFRKTHPQARERVSKLSAFATKGEYEPLTFTLYPLKNMNNLRVVVSDLSSGNAKISQNNIDLRAVTYWNMRYPTYISKGTYRKQPELLEEVNSIALTKGINQRFWITVHVPKTTPAGTYHGYVTLYEEGASKALQLPIEFKVLNFKLKKDPHKHYSTYFGKPFREYKDLQGLDLEKARSNELKSMLAHGIDQFPSIYLYYNKSKDRLVVNNEELIDEMIRLGFKGKIPVLDGIREVYHLYYPKHKYGEPSIHWDRLVTPPVGHPIYRKIERLFKELKEYGESRGWPEFIAVPMDEAHICAAKFSARVLQAVKRAGVETMTNKDPNAADAIIYQNLNAVDIWLSKTYAYDYNEVKKNSRYDYWIYPNHNAGEIKNQTIMQKGGRMTYGFGFWKSNYSTQFPWHWRWIPLGTKNQFDYLGGHQSGNGMRMDENQKMIPSVNWETFREGYDDLRYLYTLEDAIVKREESSNAKCQQLRAKGEQLLQNIWDSIVPQQAYMDKNVWSDDNFNKRRLQIATLIEKLLVYPETNQKVAPSVIINTRTITDKNSAVNKIERSLGSSAITQYDLSPNGTRSWHPIAFESKLSTSGEGNILFTVNVDLKHDSRGRTSGKLVNWPSIYRAISRGEVVLPNYDYLYFKVRITSNRSKKIDFATPMIINFKSYEGANSDYKVNLGDKEGRWFSIAVPIKEMIVKSGLNQSKWRYLKAIKLTIAERFYLDKTKLNFEIKDISLIKLRN